MGELDNLLRESFEEISAPNDQMLLPHAAYARVELSNRFCPSVVVIVCHTKVFENLFNG